MNILLIAEESIGISFIRYLKHRTTNEVTVVASPKRKILSGATTWSTAEQLGLPRIPAEEVKRRDFPGQIVSRSIDVLISVRSRYIIPEAVLVEPKIGAFNLHTGPLPGYAGINVINWAIYNGERRHAVTLHHMNADVDSGAIAYTADIDVDADDSAATVTKKCFRESLVLLKRLISDLESDPSAIPATAQDLSQRRWFGPETPHEGYVPWEEGAKRASNFIRACSYFPFPSPWGIARTLQDTQEIGVLEAFPTDQRSDKPAGYVGDIVEPGISISAGDYWVIATEVLINGERESAENILQSGKVLRNN